MATTLFNVLFAFSLYASGCAQFNKIREPIKVTDSNWTSVMEGEWMIEFMAPWCPACKSFKEVWEEFAGWGHDLDISVAVVDVTENPGLSGRFLVTSLPTLYHVKDGMFRHYSGSRKTTDLIELIDDKKWNSIEPVAWYRDPSSLQMGLLGTFFKAAMFFRGVYSTLTEVYGIPEWLCYVIFAVLTIITGLLLGLLLVLCCDNFFPAKYIPLPPQHIAFNPKNIAANDSDLIDDTVDENNDKKAESGDEEDNDAVEQAGDVNPQETASVEDSELRKRQLRKDE
uniref:Thioredoxin domain-containing protein n=1 Tax=Arion vulgaris TaxID=1028688 RepID=A0A0B7ALV5_9EUPU